MATKKTTKEKGEVKKLNLSVSANMLIKKPHVTEKAARANEKSNAYTFIVHKNANKTEIAKAIASLYDVVPVKVTVVNVKPEVVTKRGARGVEKAYKKAVVTLRKGDSISFA